MGATILRRAVSLAVMTLVLIIAADVLFYEQTLGWTVALFTTIVLGVLLARSGLRLHHHASLWLLLLILGLIGALVIHTTPLAIVFAPLLLLMFAITERVGWTNSLRSWLMRIMQSYVYCLAQPIHDRLIVRSLQKRRGKRRLTNIKAIIGWLVILGISVLFIAMFRAANPIIESWLNAASTQLEAWGEQWQELVHPLRILLWMIVAMVTWMLLRHRPHAGKGLATLPAHRETLPRLWDDWISTTLVVRALIVFNLLFLVQTGLDMRYLWSDTALPDGLTYAQYAHRGAYPLIFTALLAGAFVLISFRPGGPAEHSTTARRLVYLWIGQNVFLVFSALWRLKMYVDVYTLSRWRVAAAVWMVLVAVGLIWVVWRIVRHRSNAWLLRANVLTAFAVLYACTFANVDRLIADYNVQHCREVGGQGVPIDLNYLCQLGPDALPSLHWLDDQLSKATHDDLKTQIQSKKGQLSRELALQTANWRGWTWRRAKLKAFAISPGSAQAQIPAVAHRRGI